MDAFISHGLNALMSGCVVGIILALFKVQLDKAASATAEANDLKFKSVHGKIDIIKDWVMSSDKKVDELTKGLNRMETKVEVLATEQKHTATNIIDLRDTVSRAMDNYGKVVRK